MKWIKISIEMPKVSEYVLVHTPYNRCNMSIAYWNGTNWMCENDKSILLNIEYWSELPNKPKE